MKPVDQDRFGDGEGNCLSACLASLLELRLDEVPLFTGGDWRVRLGEWLRERGLWALLFAPPAVATLDGARAWLLDAVPGFAIVSGPTSRVTRERYLPVVEDAKRAEVARALLQVAYAKGGA